MKNSRVSALGSENVISNVKNGRITVQFELIDPLYWIISMSFMSWSLEILMSPS